MKYEELEECKENEAQKDYEALAQNLIKEVAINLMRVSNVYTDKKYDPYKSYRQAFSYFYGKDEELKLIKQMQEFRKISLDISHFYGLLEEFYSDELNTNISEDRRLYKCLIRDVKRVKKELIEKMNNIDENIKN